jgi:pyruvate dehydrogenase E2 component (dihydrolipoamide acetyltransferase)
VTDPQSGKEYYTDNVDKVKMSGAVKLKDARTGSEVTIQNSEVKEISKDEYKAGLAAPVSKPTPAPAPATPAPAPAAAPAPAPAAEPSSAPSGTK